MRSTRLQWTQFACRPLLLLLGLAACDRGPARAIVTEVKALKPLAATAALSEAPMHREDVSERARATACSDVEKQASELGRMLPRQLDADTLATRVTATGCDLRLEYQLVTLTARDVSERGSSAMRDQVVERLCSDKGALAVMQRGGRFTNVYYDRMQAPIGLFTVAADDCGI